MTTPADTERLRFEPLGPEHVDVLIAMNSDSTVMEFLDPEPTTRGELEAGIVHYARTCMGKGLGIGFWAIVDKATDATIGWLELSAPLGEPVSEAELGYRMLPAWWGKGLATEAAGGALKHAFESVGLQRVFAHTMFVNRRSRRVMEKIGMAHVRTFFPNWENPLPGSEHGEVEYAITPETWRQMR
ncbi:MAG TPA: GNAT family N-acetyltransferase [Thermomicrobiales bacterium]|nr:GNAT family N-acetyltransferase [Thermomicrobiales bacterium]